MNVNQDHHQDFRRACEELMARGLELNQASIEKMLAGNLSAGHDARELGDWIDINLQWKYLRPMLEQDQWQEVALHGPLCGQLTTPERISAFEIGPWPKDDYQLALEMLAYRHGVAWNQQHPFASFQMYQGALNLRATLLHSSIMPIQTSKLFWRCAPRFTPHARLFTSEDSLAALLEQLIIDKDNIIVAGATGSGKTTLLRALLNLIPREEHVVTVEDTMEFTADSPFKTGMVSHGDARQMRHFLAWSMRISPKRIILGEVRSEEIVPLFLALNTGHRGLLATVHANSAQEVPERLALLYGLYHGQSNAPWKNLMQMLCRGIQWVIFLEDKRIVQIIKLLGSDGNVPFYEEVYNSRPS